MDQINIILNLRKDSELYLNNKFNEYEKAEWANGLLRISNFGRGVWVNIVVKGSKYGNIWFDDRNNDNGIYPYSTKHKNGYTFIERYGEWLNSILYSYVDLNLKSLLANIIKVIN